MRTKKLYRKSAKREATRVAKREAIKAAAWEVFAEAGLDAATVARIVTASGVSTGSFYNYFGSCEAVFAEVLADMIGIIRARTQAARSASDDLGAMLQRSYKAFLDFVLETEGGLAFCARNQPHIRARLFGLENTGQVLDDLRADLAGALPEARFAPWEVGLIASLIFATGLEALLQAQALPEVDTGALADSMARLMMHGIGGWSDRPEKGPDTGLQ